MELTLQLNRGDTRYIELNEDVGGQHDNHGDG